MAEGLRGGFVRAAVCRGSSPRCRAPAPLSRMAETTPVTAAPTRLSAHGATRPRGWNRTSAPPRATAPAVGREGMLTGNRNQTGNRCLIEFRPFRIISFHFPACLARRFQFLGAPGMPSRRQAAVWLPVFSLPVVCTPFAFTVVYAVTVPRGGALIWRCRTMGAGGKGVGGARRSPTRSRAVDSYGTLPPGPRVWRRARRGGASGAAVGPAQARAQSKSASSRHILWRITASLRATATRARFEPLRSCKARPQSLSAQGRFRRPRILFAAS